MANYDISGITETTALGVVSLAEAKQYLRVDFSDDDQQIKDIILAVINKIIIDTHYPIQIVQVTEYFKNWPINKDNTFTLRFGGEFADSDNLYLEYFAPGDTSRTELTVGSDYRYQSFCGLLKIEMRNTPNLDDRLDAIRISYAIEPVGKNTDTLKIAALMLIQHYYDNRSAVSYLRTTEMPLGYKNIINQFKSYIW